MIFTLFKKILVTITLIILFLIGFCIFVGHSVEIYEGSIEMLGKEIHEKELLDYYFETNIMNEIKNFQSTTNTYKNELEESISNNEIEKILDLLSTNNYKYLYPYIYQAFKERNYGSLFILLIQNKDLNDEECSKLLVKIFERYDGYMPDVPHIMFYYLWKNGAKNVNSTYEKIEKFKVDYIVNEAKKQFQDHAYCIDGYKCKDYCLVLN